MLVKKDLGRAVTLEGDPTHNYTRGNLCRSQKEYLDNVVYNPGRILHPHRRVEDTWSSWKLSSDHSLIEELVIEIRKTVETHTSASILHIQGDEYPGLSGDINRMFFRSLGGVTTVTSDMYVAAGLTAQKLDFGSVQTSDPADLINSKLIILWGKNVAQSAIHLSMILQAARKKGARILLIDPLYTPTVKYADAHYQITPGSDSSLALAMAWIILKEQLYDADFTAQYIEDFSEFRSAVLSQNLEELCRSSELSPDIVKNIAHLYAKTRQSVIMVGRAVTRTERGGQHLRLIDALAAITGKIGISGGGVFFHHVRENINSTILNSIPHPNERCVSPSELLGLLESSRPPIQMVFINHCNPVMEWASGHLLGSLLRKVPVVVYMGMFLNDTADCATHFLPSVSMLEQRDIILSPFHKDFNVSREVISPRRSSRPDSFYYRKLARRLNLEHPAQPDWWYLRQMIHPHLSRGMDPDQMYTGEPSSPLSSSIAYTDRQFKTGSGKIELITSWDFKLKRNKQYPLTLVCPSLRKWHAQTLPPEKQTDMIIALIHPETMNKLNLSSGQIASLSGMSGTIAVRIQDDPEQRRDVVVVPFGRWAMLGGNITHVIPPLRTDLGGGMVLSGTGVIVR